MINSLGYFEFEYENGFKQIKKLISLSDFKAYLKLREQQTNLELQLKGKKKDPLMESALKVVKKDLTEFSFPFIVEGSPMHEAIETGIIELPETQGGKHIVKVKQVQAPQKGLNDIE